MTFRSYRPKYLGIKHQDVCNMFPNGSERKRCICAHTHTSQEANVQTKSR